MGKMKQYEWLSRTLVSSPFHYALCTSPSGFEKLLKQIEIPKEEWPDYLPDETKDACVYTFETGDTKLCIVTINEDGSHTTEEIYGLLAHEATHIWQRVREDIGESCPSSEFEAYSIQNISQNLMESYKRQTSKKTKKGKK